MPTSELFQEYEETLNDIERLDTEEGLEFMWTLQELLDEVHAADDTGMHYHRTKRYQPFEDTRYLGERIAFGTTHGLLENSRDHEEFVDSVRLLHGNLDNPDFPLPSNLDTSPEKYLEDIVAGVYRNAYERVIE